MQSDLSNLTKEDWTQVKEVFDTAAELEPEQRAAYLETISTVLRQRVQYLLEALNAETQVGAAVDRAAAWTLDAKLPGEGERLGPYRITGVIGRGGMSVVYRAVRADDTYRQEVAIKAAALGVSSPQLLERFITERQILANLEHPNITRLMDGGTTAEGIPYVVMELVSGQPIDAWCEEQRLDRRQRIQLMVEVARAVNYAHQHLVVHRDLKPDNIYVNGEGIPKLMDFGIAKALDPRGAGVGGSLTVDATRLMTPEYASPEQVRGEPVTTATDVYQLGIVLYFLLTGKRPFHAVTGRMSELEHAICELPPPRPNLDRDLDLVLLKALEKDPARRYISAGALADDLDRYLDGFAIEAHAPSKLYRTGKFIARHKLATATVSFVLLLIVGSSVALAVLARRYALERNAAQVQLHRAERESDFLETIFTAADPTATKGNILTATDLLDQGAAHINSALNHEPEVQERLLYSLGLAYTAMGQYAKAERLFNESLSLRRQLFGERSPEVAECLQQVAEAESRQGEYRQAIASAKEAVDISSDINGLYSKQSADRMSTLAMTYSLAGKSTEAVSTGRQEIQVLEKIKGTQDPALLAPMSVVAAELQDEGDLSAAETEYQHALSIARAHAGDPNAYQLTAEILTHLAGIENAEGKHLAAEPLAREAITQRTQQFGRRHIYTGLSEVALASILRDEHRYDEALKLFFDAIDIHSRALGHESRYVASDENGLGMLYEDRNDYAKAEQTLRDAAAIRTKLFGAATSQVAAIDVNLARVLIEEGKLKEASSLLEEVLAVREKIGDTNLPAMADYDVELGRLQLAQKQWGQAAQSERQALSIYQATSPLAHPRIVSAQELLNKALANERT